MGELLAELEVSETQNVEMINAFGCLCSCFTIQSYVKTIMMRSVEIYFNICPMDYDDEMFEPPVE